MKLLPLWIGFAGFIGVLGGVGNIETDPNGLWSGVLVIVIGFVMMVAALWIGRYLEKREEIPDWERRFWGKKKKRLGLA